MSGKLGTSKETKKQSWFSCFYRNGSPEGTRLETALAMPPSLPPFPLMSILIDVILILQLLLMYLYNSMFTLMSSWFRAGANAVLKYDCMIGCGDH